MPNRRTAAAHDKDRSLRTQKGDRGAPAAAPKAHAPAALGVQRAVHEPEVARPGEILTLQRTHGNRAVSTLLASGAQPKLMVGPAHDAYEREADYVAERVMSAAGPGAARQAARVGDERSLRREPAPEEDELAQAKPLADGIVPIRRRAATEAGFEADKGTEQRLNLARGGGRPLPNGTRTFMEQRFGASFGGVRVHTGSAAAQLSRDLQAQAFTHGSDIFFNAGKYNPASTSGQRLLAHELTHVVQQGGGGPARLQRRIGFEYEMNHWSTWQVVPATDFDAATSIYIRDAQGRDEYREAMRTEEAHKATKWKRLTKGEVLLENGDLEVTADDDGALSDLELRSKALDEGNAGAVSAAANLVGTTLDEMRTEMATAYRAYHYLRSRDLTGTLKLPASFLTTLSPQKKTGKPQITTGVRLEALPSLIRNMFPDPDETATERTRRKEGRLKGTGWDQDVHNLHPLLATMGAAPGKAERAIANYLGDHRNAPNPASDKLKGLVALLIAYLDMGKSGLVRSYAKTIAPIMARTDFAKMFTLLPNTERDYYAGDEGGKFVDLLKEAGYSWFAMRSSVYSGDIKESQEPNKWYLDLKRKDWLKSMTASSTTPTGVDKLTPTSYPTQRGRDEIEGLGSYATRTDTVNTPTGPINVPILELRALPNMEPDAFADLVVKVARLVNYLNQGQDKTLGEA